MSTLELELSYLAAFLPHGLGHYPSAEIIDIYPPAGPGPAVRIRKRGDVYEYTTKVRVDPKDAGIQTEDTTAATATEFRSQIALGYPSLAKTRYLVPIASATAEVDVFRGSLSGLVVVEFEFASRAEKGAFVAPDFCLADVTQDELVAGRSLAGRSYADIEASLARYGYASISCELTE